MNKKKKIIGIILCIVIISAILLHSFGLPTFYPRVEVPGGYLGMTRNQLFKENEKLRIYKEAMDGEGYYSNEHGIAYVMGIGKFKNRVTHIRIDANNCEVFGIQIGMDHNDAVKIITEKGFKEIGWNVRFKKGNVVVEFHSSDENQKVFFISVKYN